MDMQKTEDLARELLDGRIQSVRTLVEKRERVATLRDELADAERDDVSAYRQAIKDGWSADELKKLGIDEPEKKRRTRRRAAKAGTGAESKPAASETSADAGMAARTDAASTDDA